MDIAENRKKSGSNKANSQGGKLSHILAEVETAVFKDVPEISSKQSVKKEKKKLEQVIVPAKKEEVKKLDQLQMEVSVHAIEGAHNNQTITLTGQCGKKSFQY